MNSSDHIQFEEQIAAYLAGGLEGDERARFESHRDACDACREKLHGLAAADRATRDLFRDIAPPADFEDRLIQNLRVEKFRRRWVHPAVRKAALAAAALIVLGGVGALIYEQANPRQQQLALESPALAQRWDDSADYDDDYAQPANAPRSGGGAGGLGAEAGSRESMRMKLRTADGHVTFNHAQPPGAADAKARASNEAEWYKTPQPPEQSRPVELSMETPRSSEITEGITPQSHGYFTISGDSDSGSGDARFFGGSASKGAAPEQQVAQSQQPTRGVQGQNAAGRPVLGAELSDVQAPAEGAPVVQPPAAERKIIRSGEMEFEIDSFDSASTQIAKIVAEEKGQIASSNSEKLPNGKVKGTITLRVPPENLDQLVLKLRALGDLKRQQLGSSDVTKQYTDLQSELRAAQAMQDRLIEMIKSGKGEIKDLLAAEKELAVWRGKTEKIQGEINYYNNLISMATLQITLYERDIKTPAAATEREEVSLGVETPDVVKAREQAIAAVDEAKGRIIESDLKQHDAGQLAARIVAEVPQDQSGPLLDRLRQLGVVARLDIQRRQTTPEGNAPTAPVRIERADARIVLSLYNLANIAPRQTMNLNLAAPDVEAAHAAVTASVEEAGGRIITSQLNCDKPEQTTAVVHLDVPTSAADQLLQSLRALGDVMQLTTTSNPDTANVTAAKRGFQITLVPWAQIPARETATLQLAALDVPQAYHALVEAARAAGARIISSSLNEQDPQNIAAAIDIEIPRDQRDVLERALAQQGQVISRQVTRSTDTQNTLDSKLRLQLGLGDAENLPPRVTSSMSVRVPDVDAARQRLLAAAEKAGARTIESTITADPEGNSSATIVLDAPLSALDPLRLGAEDLGKVRARQSAHDPHAPAGKLARARLHVTLGDAESIVAADQGFWETIRRGLATSVTGLLWSLQFIIIGLCLVAPWALLLWAAWRITKRRRPVTA